jgi:DNA-binding transcriptional MocR family regulator
MPPPNLLQYSSLSEVSQYQLRGGGANQLADSLEEAIARGDLRPGDPLPPVRQLARELSISPTTVTAALARLRSRGLIVSRERSRSHVSWRPPRPGPWPLLSIPPGARDLATGNPDPALLPSLAPFLHRLAPDVRLYAEEPALPELQRLAADEFAQAGIAGDHVTIVSGALDGIERALDAQLRPGDLVAVEDPGYPGVIDLCRALGLALAPVAVDERGMRPEALARALADGAEAVVITPRGQNPTGGALDERRADELRAVLDERLDVLVLEDDHLGPVVDAPRITVTAGRARWAAARSVSKSLGPDLRVALLAGDEQTIERVEGRLLLGPQWVSHILQRLVVALWTDPKVLAGHARARDAYRERRVGLVAALAEHGIEVAAPTGLNVWIPVPDEAAAIRELAAKGWAVSAGAPFRLEAPPAIRITASTLEPPDAERLAADVAAALKPQRRTRAA